MLSVYKYRLHYGENTVALPEGAQPLTVRGQHGEIMLWCLVDTEAAFKVRGFLVIQTGERIGLPLYSIRFIGTVEMEDGWIGHVFEVKA